MSCVYKIRTGMGSYTSTEKKIADYILQNKNEVIQNSVQTLGERIGVSASAVIRFSHKIGYKGFTALKVDLARDSSKEVLDFDDVIKENDSMDVVVQKSKNLSSMLLEQTYRLINFESLEKAVNILLNCDTVYLFGISGSGIVCMDFMEKLSRINRRAVYHSDFHNQLAAEAHITSKDAALAISYGGRTHDVNTAVKYAKEHGAATIAITQFSKTPLCKLADINLYIPTTERELRLGAIASRNASLAITDLLYLGLAKENISLTKEYLVKTKEIINQIK
ncbi:MAG: MurR/RpiR family transcriptional regulator [Oscillospiraceae bacterium]|jgi:RpiR family murPQ operon transcriptional repressor|nr:MurR/RpiR family transcriptional regulator [Oscillospiraceae bacterium]